MITNISLYKNKHETYYNKINEYQNKKQTDCDIEIKQLRYRETAT